MPSASSSMTLAHASRSLPPNRPNQPPSSKPSWPSGSWTTPSSETFVLITIFPISVLLALVLSAATDVDAAASAKLGVDRPPSSRLGRRRYRTDSATRCWRGVTRAMELVPAELIDRARAGDGEAFRALTEPHRRELQVHCYRMLGSLQDAEDALQDTLLAAWQGLGGFEGRASIRTWLYRIATNRCLDALSLGQPTPGQGVGHPRGRPARADPARRGRVARAVSRRPPRRCDRRAARPRGPLRADRIHLAGLRDRAAGPAASPARRARPARRPRIPRATRWPTCSTRPSSRSPAPSSGRAPACSVGGRRPTSTSRRPRPTHRPSRRSWPSSSAPTSPPISTRCVALLTDDVFMSMPPMPFEYEGRDVVARFCAGILRRGPPVRPRRRPGPTVSRRSAPTCAAPTGVRHGTGLFVLTLSRRPDLRHDPLREQRASRGSGSRDRSRAARRPAPRWMRGGTKRAAD